VVSFFGFWIFNFWPVLQDRTIAPECNELGMLPPHSKAIPEVHFMGNLPFIIGRNIRSRNFWDRTVVKPFESPLSLEVSFAASSTCLNMVPGCARRNQ
jgi:hypothetical protein